MSRVAINVGAAANDGTGDPLRTAFQSANAAAAEGAIMWTIRSVGP